MSDLLNYFHQKPRIDSEGQLREARAKAETYTPEQNAQARAAGFRDANEMILFMKARRKGATVQDTGPTPSLDAAMAWHPAKTIGRAASELDAANKRNRR